MKVYNVLLGSKTTTITNSYSILFKFYPSMDDVKVEFLKRYSSEDWLDICYIDVQLDIIVEHK